MLNGHRLELSRRDRARQVQADAGINTDELGPLRFTDSELVDLATAFIQWDKSLGCLVCLATDKLRENPVW